MYCRLILYIFSIYYYNYISFLLIKNVGIVFAQLSEDPSDSEIVIYTKIIYYLNYIQKLCGSMSRTHLYQSQIIQIDLAV